MHDNVANRQHGATRRVEKVISCAPFATLSKQREDSGESEERGIARSGLAMNVSARPGKERH